MLFTVTFTGTPGNGLPSSSVTLPVMFPGWFGVLFSGTSTSIFALTFSTFNVSSALAGLYLSFPGYSTVTGIVPTVSVGTVAT